MQEKPVASLSLDLDNQWSYMKTHGDAGWESFPSYHDVLVPRVLSFLRERHLDITFFIVGQDAALDRNRDALAQIAAAGHEIGNHSFHHEPWLHLRAEQEIEDELKLAEEHIERVTAHKPVGFRGPGFSLSHRTLRVLARRGYRYDASTFPTFIGPLSRAYYFMTAKLSDEQREQRKELFGTISEGLRPLKPFRWHIDGDTLLEIPVTTMPIFKVPIHVSYLLYLSAYAPALALRYFQSAVKLCRLTKTQPSLLLHPLDFLGCDDHLDALSFFPGMNLTSDAKLATVSEVLRLYAREFRVVTVKQHAEEATPAAATRLRTIHSEPEMSDGKREATTRTRHA
jgi:hypothetical protein